MTQFDDDDRTYPPDEQDSFDEFAPESSSVNPNHGFDASSTNTRAQSKSIKADYFAIVDMEDWPIAGLVVLVDRRRQAVRAELHLYEDGERQNEYALRQAQDILGGQYFSQEPVQLQVMQSYPWRETLEIHANADAPAASPQSEMMGNVMDTLQDYWQYIAGGVALILLILLISWIASFFRSPDSEITDLPTTPVSQDVTTGNGDNSGAVAPTAAPVVGEQTNGLGPSINADANIAVQSRVRVLPGVNVSLVSEPVPDQDKVVGFLESGAEATVIDGPVRKQGTSDTIVWWRIRLDDGTEAWVPANTSEYAVLAAVN